MRATIRLKTRPCINACCVRCCCQCGGLPGAWYRRERHTDGQLHGHGGAVHRHVGLALRGWRDDVSRDQRHAPGGGHVRRPAGIWADLLPQQLQPGADHHAAAHHGTDYHHHNHHDDDDDDEATAGGQQDDPPAPAEERRFGQRREPDHTAEEVRHINEHAERRRRPTLAQEQGRRDAQRRVRCVQVGLTDPRSDAAAHPPQDHVKARHRIISNANSSNSRNSKDNIIQ